MMSNANRSGALLCFIANMIEDGSHPKIDVESGHSQFYTDRSMDSLIIGRRRGGSVREVALR